MVVWNDGPPPDVESEFRSVVPVRLRVEAANRLSNRFLPDSLLRTRAVLMLDDDTLMRCSDVERGFARWLEQPQALVGFFPRIVRIELPGFGERRVFKLRQYNVILTGAAFIDSEHLFPLNWSEEYQEGGRPRRLRFMQLCFEAPDRSRSMHTADVVWRASPPTPGACSPCCSSAICRRPLQLRGPADEPCGGEGRRSRRPRGAVCAAASAA